MKHALPPKTPVPLAPLFLAASSLGKWRAGRSVHLASSSAPVLQSPSSVSPRQAQPPSMPLQDPIAVWTAPSNAEAQLVCELLEEAGIEAFAVEDNSPAGM